MNAKAEITTGLDARKIKALALIGSLAGKKYDTRITNSYASGALNILNNLTKGKNIVGNKLVEKTFSATTKFFNNMKNRINR